MSGANDPDLAHWHARARVGDVSARDRVIALLYPHLRAVLRRRLSGYPRDVQVDALQEAIVCVFDQLPTCRATTARQLVGWAGVVGWRAAIRYLRSPAAGLRTGLNALDLAAAVAVAEAATAPVRHPPRVHPGPHEAAARALASAVGDALGDARHGAPGIALCDVQEDDIPAERAALTAAVIAAWAELNPANAAVLWLRAAHRRPYREIADARGITPSAAKRRYQRAMAQLRAAVAVHVARLPEPTRSAVLRRISGAAAAGGAA